MVNKKNPTKAELERIKAVISTCYAATLINPLLILHYLILPSNGFQYSQELFSSVDYPLSPFSAVKHPFELCIGDTLHIDTPFNGHCDCIVVAVRMMRLPSDEPAALYRYVVGTFGYFGNGSAQPLGGCCGGVVWTDEVEPIGQLCYLDKEDSTAYITSYEHLIDLGYKLSNIEEDT